MMEAIPGLDVARLTEWVESSIEQNTNLLASGYQGRVFLYQDQQQSLVIKAPPKSGLLKWVYRMMLKHEYKAYQALQDVPGVAKCYGLLDQRYLVLQFIEGKTLRLMNPSDSVQYYKDLLALIQTLHDKGVVHSDLKRKDNILVSSDGKPYVIDFGAAVVFKKRFAPFNHYIFSLAKRFDLNAWVKHKYSRAYDRISDEDKQYFHFTRAEKFSKVIKRFYLRFKRKFLKSERANVE